MKLTLMTQEYFEVWRPQTRDRFAKNKMKANGYSKEVALKIATEALNTYLPQGVETLDHYLYTLDNEEGDSVGMIWWGVRGENEGLQKAYLYEIYIEEGFQGQGLGHTAMELLEDDVKAKGLNHIGLHVFGHNERAVYLYGKIGYETTDLIMEKKLQ